MVIRPRLAAPIALAILAACRTPAPPAAIDPALSARVPAATVALAGVDLDRLRTSPLYAKLPPAAQAFLEPFGHAHHVLDRKSTCLNSSHANISYAVFC